MKKYLIVLGLMLLYINPLFSQADRINELKAKLKHSKPKEKVEIYLELSDLIDDYNECKQLCEKAIEISKDLKDDKLLANSFFMLGGLHAFSGNYSDAEQNLLNAFNLSAKNADTVSLAAISYRLASCYKYWGKYRTSAKYAQICLDLNEKLKLNDGIISSNLVFGYLYQVWGNQEQALFYFNKAQSLMDSKKETNGLGFVLLGKGEVYFATGKTDSAKLLFDKANKAFIYLKNTYGEALTLRDMGRYWILKKEYEKAEIVINQSLKLLETINNKRGISQLLVLKGDLSFIRGDYNSAIKLYQQGQKLAKEMGLHEEVYKNYKSISDAFDAKKDNINTLKYYKLYSGLKDSLFTSETYAQLTEMQTKYETEKKERENQSLKNDIDLKQTIIKRQYFIVFLIIVVLVLVLVLTVIFFKGRQKEKQNNIILEQQKNEIEAQRNNLELLNEELQKQKLQIANQRDEIEAELRDTLVKSEILEKEKIIFQYEALKNQVNPHFLFNNFSTLQGLISEDKAIAEKYINELTNVYRYLLVSSEENLQNLQLELKLIESYMFLVNIRFDNHIHIYINIDESCINCYIPLLSLQLLIENAIKHNVINTKKELTINIHQSNDVLEVKNNRNPKIKPEISTGLGLQNIINRYKLLTDKQVEIESNNDEFIVRLPVLRMA